MDRPILYALPCPHYRVSIWSKIPFTTRYGIHGSVPVNWTRIVKSCWNFVANLPLPIHEQRWQQQLPQTLRTRRIPPIRPRPPWTFLVNWHSIATPRERYWSRRKCIHRLRMPERRNESDDSVLVYALVQFCGFFWSYNPFPRLSIYNRVFLYDSWIIVY